MAHGDTYFAWVDDEEVEFDPVTHKRRDEEFETASLKCTEDGFALLRLTVKPPEGGMLKPSRKLWGLFSYEKADGSLVLLARGRVDAFPLGGDPEESEITLKCAPTDWEAMQDAALQATKTGPHWAAVLVAPENRDDPVEILDGLSAVIDFHPATHAVALHDIFGTGLPLWDIGLRWYDDSLEAEPIEPPISAVEIELSAQWTQRLSGVLNAASAISSAFGGGISTLTPEDFLNRWPQEGDGISEQSGYYVRTSSIERAYPAGQPTEAGPFHGSSDVYNYITDSNLTAPIPREVMFERAWFDASLTIGWSAEQKRHERLTIRLTSGIQGGSLGDGGVRRIQLECQDVTVDDVTPEWQPLTYYAVGDLARLGGRVYKRMIAGTSKATVGEDFTQWDMGTFPPTLLQVWEAQAEDQSPLGSPTRGAFLTTARGQSAVFAAVLRGRAILAEAMRAPRITFEVPVDDAITAGISLGMRARIEVPENRLAIEGDTVVGKVGEFELFFSAADDYCRVTIRPAMGSGKGTAVPSGSSYVSPTGEAWDRIALPSLSSITPRAMRTGGIIRCRVTNGVADQIAYIEARDYDPGAGRADPQETDPARLLGDVPTGIEFDLQPIETDDEMLLEAYVEATIPFEGPRQIDLGEDYVDDGDEVEGDDE